MGLRRVISNFVATISSCRCIAAGLRKRKNRMDDPIVQYVYIYKWWLYLQVDFKYFIFQ